MQRGRFGGHNNLRMINDANLICKAENLGVNNEGINLFKDLENVIFVHNLSGFSACR